MSERPEDLIGANLSPDDAAAHWDARLRSPNCREIDRDAFRAWREADPEHEAAFERLQALLTALRDEKDRPELQAMREAALRAAPERPAMWRRAATIVLPLAAAAAVGIILVQQTVFPPAGNGPIIADRGGQVDPELAPIQTVDMHVPPFYATSTGERSTVTLEDGSLAVLNTDTLIRASYSEGQRLVTLERGQASFTVEKDAGRPFIVAAGDQRIRAIGTVFDVRLDEGDVQVTLIEGVVEVEPARPSEVAGVAPDPSQPEIVPVRMEAGQKLVALRGAMPTLIGQDKVNLDIETIWQEGRVFFEDASLRDAVAEMNRYTDVKIIAADPALDQFRVNGMFRTARQDSFLSSIEAYFPVESDAERDGEIVLKLSQ